MFYLVLVVVTEGFFLTPGPVSLQCFPSVIESFAELCCFPSDLQVYIPPDSPVCFPPGSPFSEEGCCGYLYNTDRLPAIMQCALKTEEMHVFEKLISQLGKSVGKRIENLPSSVSPFAGRKDGSESDVYEQLYWAFNATVTHPPEKIRTQGMRLLLELLTKKENFEALKSNCIQGKFTLETIKMFLDLSAVTTGVISCRHLFLREKVLALIILEKDKLIRGFRFFNNLLHSSRDYHVEIENRMVWLRFIFREWIAGWKVLLDKIDFFVDNLKRWRHTCILSDTMSQEWLRNFDKNDMKMLFFTKNIEGTVRNETSIPMQPRNMSELPPPGSIPPLFSLCPEFSSIPADICIEGASKMASDAPWNLWHFLRGYVVEIFGLLHAHDVFVVDKSTVPGLHRKQLEKLRISVGHDLFVCPTSPVFEFLKILIPNISFDPSCVFAKSQSKLILQLPPLEQPHDIFQKQDFDLHRNYVKTCRMQGLLQHFLPPPSQEQNLNFDHLSGRETNIWNSMFENGHETQYLVNTLRKVRVVQLHRPMGRSIRNRDELFSRVSSLPFVSSELLVEAFLPAKDQIEKVRSSDVLLSYFGAGVSHELWMKTGGVLIEFQMEAIFYCHCAYCAGSGRRGLYAQGGHAKEQGVGGWKRDILWVLSTTKNTEKAYTGPQAGFLQSPEFFRACSLENCTQPKNSELRHVSFDSLDVLEEGIKLFFKKKMNSESPLLSESFREAAIKLQDEGLNLFLGACGGSAIQIWES